LLDTDKRSAPGVVSAHIQRPYPGQDMPVPISYRQVPTVHEKVEDEVRLPLGVHIVAAMNSTDRSVAPLDAAMRRRFTVIRVGPDYEALAEHLLGDTAIANQPLPTTNDVSSWDVNQVCVLAIRLLESLNERIEYCLGEDFLLGHALVWRMDGADVAARLEQLAIAVDTKIVPTLRTTFIDQDDALAAILGVPDSLIVNQGQSAPTGTVAYWKAAPAALASIAPKRLALQMARRMPVAEQLVALRALTTK
jgi:5-methylcytosine-specific restriction protein B